MESLSKNPALLISLLNSGGLVGLGLWAKNNIQSLDNKVNILEEKNKQLDAIGKALVGQNNNLQQDLREQLKKLIKNSKKDHQELCEIRKDLGVLIISLNGEEKIPKSLVKKYSKMGNKDSESEESDSDSGSEESDSDSEDDKPKKKGKRGKKDDKEEEDDKSARLVEQLRKNRKG
jgi:hypothetical protein